MENTPTTDLAAMRIHFIAKACHEANKAFCESVGDYSQKPWDIADEWQRQSAITGVQFRIDNPTATEDAQHNSWMEEKVKDGWVYGEVKDAEKKTHPCIVPFNHLPEFQQKKDTLFCAIVDALKDKAPKTELTFGEKAVGITFNPGGSKEVNGIKKKCAEVIDELDAQRSQAKLETNGEKIAMFTLAIRDIQSGQMWGVKAATWQN
jgi:hypothetical protein